MKSSLMGFVGVAKFGLVKTPAMRTRVTNWRRLALAGLTAASLGLGACANNPGPAWKSPADPELLGKLEAKTLESAASVTRRAQLFFLWGQELAAMSRQTSAVDGQSAAAGPSLDPGQLRRQAIGAFERVIDLGAGLVDESRFNLEILLRDQQRQEQVDQERQPDQDKQQPESPKDQTGGNQGKPDGQEDQPDGQSGQADKSPAQPKKAARDLSPLVKDKAQDASLDQALKQENARKAQEQAMHFGSIVPVEKDW